MDVKMDGQWKEIVQKISTECQDMELHIGILEGATHASDADGSDIDLVFLGFIHEFGGITMPQHSFLRRGLDEFGPQWLETIKQYLKSNFESFVANPRATFKATLEVAGHNAADDVRNLFYSGLLTPQVSDARLKKKLANQPANANNPLVYTGQLAQAIKHEVKNA
jgi:hypothetical protein